MKAIHYLCGGGLGDVFREAIYHNVVGILKRWKAEHPGSTLKVLLMSHNPASKDLLKGLDFIDELVQRDFPVRRTWAWEDAYTLYPEEFEDHTELRFTLPERRSLYASQFNQARPRKKWPVEYIDPIGTVWEPILEDLEPAQAALFENRVVVHPGAGQGARALPPDLTEYVLRTAPDTLLLGANYQRHEHERERGWEVSPRVLYHGLKKARAVVGAESSVWYLGTLLAKPTLLLYHPEQTYDLVEQGKSNWNWFFQTHPDSVVAKLPIEPSALDQWLLTQKL